MNCQDVRDNLSAYIDGELDKHKSSSMAAHLLTCSHCHQEWEQLKVVSGLLHNLPEVEPPPEFIDGLNKKISTAVAAESTSQKMRRVVQKPWYKFAAVAAVFGMALGVSTLWSNENMGFINQPQITNTVKYAEEQPQTPADDKNDLKVDRNKKQQVASNQKMGEEKQPAVQPRENKSSNVPTTKDEKPAASIKNTLPLAQTESVYKPAGNGIATNVSTLSIKISVPDRDFAAAGQKVRDIAAKYKGLPVENNNEFDIKFPLGTDISLLLDEFRTIGEVGTIPIKDVTKEYKAEIRELEQKKAELKAQQEIQDTAKIQQELDNVQNEINKKCAEIKELSNYVNIVVKLVS